MAILSDYNTSPPPDDGSETDANEVKWATIRTQLTDVLKAWIDAPDLDGNKLILDADGDTSITADTDDQIDFEVGGSDVMVLTANSLTLKNDADLSFSGGAIPLVNNTSPLGTTSLTWSDLFLGTGGVINWASGDVTLTHSSNQLALGGGDLKISADFIFNADGVSDIGKTAVRAANVWSDLINGADYGFENGWRAIESDTYGGYGPGIAFDFGPHFEEGKAFATKKIDNGRVKIEQDENGDDIAVKTLDRERVTGVPQTPHFAVTEDFIEFKGKRITAKILDQLIALLP